MDLDFNKLAMLNDAANDLFTCEELIAYLDIEIERDRRVLGIIDSTLLLVVNSRTMDEDKRAEKIETFEGYKRVWRNHLRLDEARKAAALVKMEKHRSAAHRMS